MRTTFAISLNITIRRAREEDLAAMEWYGMFAPHREILRETFAMQQRGEVVMLVAEAKGFPAGQAWVDLRRLGNESLGVLWAVRVFPLLQGLGIGTRLIGAAEEELRARGARGVEISAERDNPRARALYERLGYAVTDEREDFYTYTTPEGRTVTAETDEWVMHKDLEAAA
jgi:ribosomal protein S18 acetylase RimI-like enzyme